MKKLVLFCVMCLLVSGIAYAQQDPDDPGIQDSIILGSPQVDSGAVFVGVPLYVVTDDTVMFYNIPIRYDAPLGGFHPRTPHAYFPPLTSWDERYDTVITSQNYIRQIGFCEYIPDSIPNPPLNTNGQRVQIMTLAFNIDPGTNRQYVTLDTCWDDRNLSVMFGLSNGISEITPAFVRGRIGFGLGVEENGEVPRTFTLEQNYPNPFNPETNIDFALPTETNVSLIVYNLLGQEVQTLIDGKVGAGQHTAHWNGKNQNGVTVPSGVYFYKMTTPEFTQTNKMVLVR